MLKRLWQAWKELAHRIGNFQARVVLTIFYALLAPFGVGTRLFSDPLRTKNLPTQWQDHTGDGRDMQAAMRQ
jgi:hypothetical protein